MKKNRFLKWLDELPYPMLILPALLLGLAPFTPEPHLLEKLRWLSQGELSRAIDIFDLFLHATPLILLVVKVGRSLLLRQGGSSDPHEDQGR
ncbi:MAG: RND transporter [Gammaproteobacteria bacterium]|nr:RND transporter [Gammaproteobacteria bacterium]